ncbi:MAG: histidine kinase [Saprospiraceae bacterium]|nr:histidine kinase [Saprospiraceae bacterium]
MQQQARYLGLIIFGAIFITALANIGLLDRYYKLSQAPVLSAARAEEYWFIWKIGFVGVIFDLMILLVFFFYNYSWKDYFLPPQSSPTNSLVLIGLGNAALLLGFIYLDFIISKHLTEVIAESYITGAFLQNYLINHASIIIIAIIAPYILLRIAEANAIALNLVKVQEEKTKAELAALKEQISPHFFFNTLSTLRTIVRNESKENGLEFIQDISKIFRYTLKEARADLVLLKQELDFITSYVYLLQKRFGKKLQFEMDILDSDWNASIPSMSIQLLIENAIQHNIMTQNQPLKITIQTDGQMISVANNLQEKEQVESFGLGLNNLNNRYKLLAQQEIAIKRDTVNFTVQLPLL